jgi:hypothetical protein
VNIHYFGMTQKICLHPADDVRVLKLYMTLDRMLEVLLIVLYFLREGKGIFAILKLK